MQQGIYRRIRSARPGQSLKPAVFLDRDGVIVEDPGYLASASDIRYIDGSLEAIRQLNGAGHLVIMVTNQSGIARGYYGWPEFEAVQTAISSDLARAGGWFDGVWACPFASDHPFRKPNPGMLLESARLLCVDLSRAVMVGDKTADIYAGLSAGVGRSFLVETGQGLSGKGEARALAAVGKPVAAVPNLASAVATILSQDFAVSTLSL